MDAFDYDLIEQYYTKNLSESQFWLFGSSANEEEKPSSDNTDRDAIDFLERVVFGIKYQLSDFSFMLPIRLWQQNFIYKQYDDREVLKNTPFYIVVEPEFESGSYHIFKCVSNNNQSVSLEKPVFNPSIQDGIYTLSDGYVWKFMGSTPFTQFKKFAARGLMPVARDQQIENIANDGVFNVVVENRNRNSGYDRITGNVDIISIENGLTRVFLKNLFSQTQSEIPVFEIDNSYLDRSIYIQKSNLGSGIGAIEAKIIQSGVLSNQPFVLIETPSNFLIQQNDVIEILPRVLIKGDGEGASAIAVFDDNNFRIDSINVLSTGSGYTNAIATVVDPVGFDPENISREDTRCIVRPIISPKGGHGSNILSELKSKHIGLSSTIKSLGDTFIPKSGSYSKLGVIKNPSFNYPVVAATASLGSTTIELESVDNVMNGQGVSYENSIPQNTVIINIVGNTITISNPIVEPIIEGESILVEYADFDNRIKIQLTEFPGNINVGDEIFQGEIRAVVHEINAEENTLFVSDYEGPYSITFNENDPITFGFSDYVINSIKYSAYEGKTGDVLIISDVTPIERNETRSEQIRLILDF